jgi:predicted transcriptional regulator
MSGPGDDRNKALRRPAEAEGRSMQAVAQDAIAEYIERQAHHARWPSRWLRDRHLRRGAAPSRRGLMTEYLSLEDRQASRGLALRV